MGQIYFGDHPPKWVRLTSALTRTEVTEAGSTVEAGYWLQVLDKPTRARRDWQLDDDFEYAPEELDRSVQTPDQIRTIGRTLRDRWRSDLFPQREALPKTLVFAKDDNHAEEIVRIPREEWGRGNEFADASHLMALASVRHWRPTGTRHG